MLPLSLFSCGGLSFEIPPWGDGKALDDPSSNVLDGEFGFVPFFVLMRAVVHRIESRFCFLLLGHGLLLFRFRSRTRDRQDHAGDAADSRNGLESKGWQ